MTETALASLTIEAAYRDCTPGMAASLKPANRGPYEPRETQPAVSR